MRLSDFLDVHLKVAAALDAGRPVVALESSIISHGAPWPKNAETALVLEAEVRSHGAIPAACAIMDGRIKVGLTREEIERLARGGRDVAKVSRRDIPILVACGGDGATTISASISTTHSTMAAIKPCLDTPGRLAGRRFWTSFSLNP